MEIHKNPVIKPYLLTKNIYTCGFSASIVPRWERRQKMDDKISKVAVLVMETEHKSVFVDEEYLERKCMIFSI